GISKSIIASLHQGNVPHSFLIIYNCHLCTFYLRTAPPLCDPILEMRETFPTCSDLSCSFLLALPINNNWQKSLYRLIYTQLLCVRVHFGDPCFVFPLRSSHRTNTLSFLDCPSSSVQISLFPTPESFCSP